MSDAKLRDLLQSMGSQLVGGDEDDELLLTEPKRIVSTGSSSASDGSVIVHKKFDQKLQKIQDQDEESEENDSDNGNDEEEQPLRIKTKSLAVEEESDDDDFNDYVIDPPLPPPKELHPGKLYALYEFSGNDPSHCELERDDAVFLLNDQDSYWWLVKKEFDGKIGFAPAECLETYHERLARLNCWKNEELERNSKDQLDEFASTRSRSDSKVNKSVAFSNSVVIADESDESDEDDTDHNERSDEESDDDRDDESSNYNDDYDDDQFDQAEFASTSDNFPVIPLTVTKNNKKSKHVVHNESDFDDDSPFVAPTAFFSVNNNTSGSIGTYSPSSSEFDSPGNTPPLTQFKKPLKEQVEDQFEKRGNIPQSKGTTNMFNSIRMLDEIINDELNTTRSLSDDQGDDTITYDDYNDDKLSSPITLDDGKKNLSNVTSSTFTNSNTSLNLTGSTTSVDNDSDARDSYENLSTPKLSISSTHPEIESIFQGSLSKMDELAEKLRLLNEQFS